MKWPRKKSDRNRNEYGFDDEMNFHLDALVEANRQKGMPENEARRRALVEFGGREQVRQQVRETHLSPLFDLLRRNFSAAVRFCKRFPGLAAAMVLILGLGIGANTAVFSALDSVLLHPLAFPHGDELVELYQRATRTESPETRVAPLRVEDWNRMNRTFQAISGWYTQSVSEISGALPEKVTEAIVAPRFFTVWGVAPALGRPFTPAEEHFGGPFAVVLSDHYWRRRFHADPAALGKRIRVGDWTYTVVGVMPSSFRFPDEDADLWLPNAPDAPYAQDRTSTWFITVGRLKPGVTMAQARADLARVQHVLGRTYPQSDGDLATRIEPLKQVVLHGVAPSLWLLYGAVSLLLLAACVNIAALLMARTTEREGEIAIRYALGASRFSIVLQLLSEALLPALMGALLGLLLAVAAMHLFQLFAKDLPRVEEIALNWRIGAYSLLCALCVTVASGLLPALRGTRRALAGGLAQSARTQVSTRMPLQWILLGVQVAMAAMLLVGAGLLVRSMAALGRVSMGFDATHVLTLHISAGYGETVDRGRLKQRIERDLDALRAIPGVESAATAVQLPGIGGAQQTELQLDGATDPAVTKPYADVRWISAGYFRTLGIPLLGGEPCQEGLPFAIGVVNRSFAQLYLPGTTALGHQIGYMGESDADWPAQIRGVAADAREQGANVAVAPVLYRCSNSADPDPWFLLRTNGSPAAMTMTVRRVLAKIEPSRSVYAVEPLARRLAAQSSGDRARTALLSMFAVTAVALVCIGLYGTVSYVARARRRETGLRLALGAMPGRILRSFLLQSLHVSLCGSVAGLIVGAAFSHLLAGMLYGISALDPWVYGGVAALLLCVCTAATLLPALRAVTVPMAEALRES